LKINENAKIKVDKGFLGILKLFRKAQVPPIEVQVQTVDQRAKRVQSTIGKGAYLD